MSQKPQDDHTLGEVSLQLSAGSDLGSGIEIANGASLGLMSRLRIGLGKMEVPKTDTPCR